MSSSSSSPRQQEDKSGSFAPHLPPTGSLGEMSNIDTVSISNETSSHISEEDASGARQSDDPVHHGEGATKYGWRALVTQGMNSFSDIVNDNIVAARYGTFATIALLSAYGASKTPLFFRYKTVSEIPGRHFVSRRTLHGRLVRIVEKNDSSVLRRDNAKEEPIICLVRHLSPGGRLLNRNAFEFFHRASPAAAVGKQLEENSNELLKVELAGIKVPPFYMAPSHVEQPGEWLRRLADQRTPVSLKLLARRVKTRQALVAQKRDSAFSGLSGVKEPVNPDDQIAVCRLGYRPGLQLFRTDVATLLVRHGRASVASSLYTPDESRTTIDCSPRLEDLKADAIYLEKLGKAEYEAANKYLGMWADSSIRAENQDTVDEANFQATAGIVQKIWRWLRG